MISSRVSDMKSLFEHIERARSLLIEVLSDVESEKLLERKKGMPSMRDLLVHLMDAEDYWVHSVILGGKRQKFEPDRYRTALDIRADWQKVHKELPALISELSDEFLDKEVTVQGEHHSSVTTAKVLFHIAIHEIHHRGQLCLMLREAGHEPPYVDFLQS